MRIKIIVVLPVLLALCAVPGNALQEFFGAGPVPHSASWPNGLAALVDEDSRFAATLGFADAWAFYTGDTDDLNAFLATCARLEDTRLQLVLHPGPMPVDMKRHDNTDRTLNADWVLHVAETYQGRTNADAFEGRNIAVTIDVYLGGQVGLAALNVPSDFDVLSGGEIEAFVEAHEANQHAKN